MKRIMVLMLGVAAISGGCASPRWSVQPYDQSWGKNAELTYKGMLLVDGNTGETWQLVYQLEKPVWKEIERGGMLEHWAGEQPKNK